MSTQLLTHDSRVLLDNPLGDPARREVGVYLPPTYDGTRRFPVVMILSGYTGSGPWMLNRAAWSPGMQDRLDQWILDGKIPPIIAVFPDCFTRYGGSQYVDSPAIGAYLSYLCDELVPFIDAQLRTLPQPESRALVGKSSGGFGALHAAFERPGIFSAIGCHAGDSAFELNYQTEFAHTARLIEKCGGIRGLITWFDAQSQKSQLGIQAMSMLCCAAAWSPTANGPYSYGVGFELPFDPALATLRDDVWQRWLAFDPVRRVDDPTTQQRLRELRAIFLDAGRDDEYGLQYGMRQIAQKLGAAKITVVHEEFDGGHRNTNHRYERSIAVVADALVRA